MPVMVRILGTEGHVPSEYERGLELPGPDLKRELEEHAGQTSDSTAKVLVETEGRDLEVWWVDAELRSRCAELTLVDRSTDEVMDLQELDPWDRFEAAGIEYEGDTFDSFADAIAAIEHAATTVDGEVPVGWVVQVPSGWIRATISPGKGFRLDPLEISVPSEHERFVSRSIGLSEMPDYPWGREHTVEPEPASPYDPNRPLVTGSARQRIEAVCDLAERKPAEWHAQLIQALEAPENQPESLSEVRNVILDHLVRSSSSDVQELWFRRLRAEPSDDVAHKLVARASKFPHMLERWVRDLADAVEDDERYAHRIGRAMHEDWARLMPHWKRFVPDGWASRLSRQVAARLKLTNETGGHTP